MVIGKLKVSDMMTSYMSEIYIEAGGVLPETLRRGPYAVVERAERAKPPSPLAEIKSLIISNKVSLHK